jgi:hypothetical protein
MKHGLIYKLRRKMQVAALAVTSPEFMSRLYFKYVLGYKLDLKNPKTFNEKLQWLKLYHWANEPKAIQCADKFSVRSYIEEVGKKEILNDLLFVWDDANEIDWSLLPEKFVLKCNHGCGYNIICKNKGNLDEKATKKLLNKWMHEDFSKFNAEPHYAKIPRKIICEKFLEGEVINYNIYVFNGKAVFFSVAGGLGDGEGEFLSYFNPDGTLADFKNRSYPAKETTLSPLLPAMIETAEFLAKDFPMVRVDLFDINGTIILSEMTFTPGGALIPFSSVEADRMLGDKLDISVYMKH